MINEKNIFKVIQITDCHLFKDEAGIMLNVNTYNTFKNVLQNIKENDLSDADAIFLTGDLSQDESQESYLKLIHSFSDFNKKIYWIPGNHDNIKTLNTVFSAHSDFIKGDFLETLYWNFIFLNTKREGIEDGFLESFELKKLEQYLTKSKSKSIAIIMHHHPFTIGTPMVDKCMLINKDQFLNTIAPYNIKMIMCGHVHGDYSIQLQNGLTLEASPATCIQWLKGAVEPAFEMKIGYKIYHFGIKKYAAFSRLWNI